MITKNGNKEENNLIEEKKKTQYIYIYIVTFQKF